MKLRLQFLSVLLCAFFTSFSQVQTINTAGMTFTPDTVIINLGDTIEFGPLGYHNAVEIDESTWIANDTTHNGGFYFSFGSPGGYFIADSAKTYYYICQPHASIAMKGLIIVNSAPIYGCMDSTATNYDPNANVDDGSCIYPLPPVENLFFSEAAEGSGNNKYFEVYNPTGDTIDLTYYAFARVTNAPGNGVGVYEAWVDFDSAAFIAPNDVYVVCHTGSGWSPVDSIILAEADMNYGSMSNGDDGFALVYGIEPATPMNPNNGGYYLLDWIGDWNGDPGIGWDVAGVSNATQNHTLVRKCSVFKGDTSWANSAGTDPINSQWIVLSQNDWSNLGFHNSCPCDSTTNSYTAIIDTICSGQSIIVGSSTYDSTGTYSDTLLAFNGCDSIISTNLTVLNTSASSTNISLSICDGDSVMVGATYYHSSGIYTQVLTNSAGCDSTVTLNLIVQTPISWNVTICDGDSIVVGNSVYYTSGNYTDTITSSIGCDSVVNTNLTIYSQFNSIYGGIQDSSVGGGGFYSGSQYLEMSCYISTELISAVVYAEDTVSETFEIRDMNGNVLSDTFVTVFPGGHRIYFNYHMTAGSDYQLGVNGNSNDLYRNNSGVSYPYNFGSLASLTSSSAGGSYYYFFYDIEVRQSSQPVNYSICDGDSVVVGGSVYTTTGLYTDSLISSIGCDSLVRTNLVVYLNIIDTNQQTICVGEVYSVGGNIYDSSGVYIDSLQTEFGCDSIIITDLLVDTLTVRDSIVYANICVGDNYVVGNSIYTNTGIYIDTLIAVNGCDSILTTHLTVNSTNYTPIFGGIYDTTVGGGGFFSGSQYLELSCYESSKLVSAVVYAQDSTLTVFEISDDNGNVLTDTSYQLFPGSNRIYFDYEMTAGSDYQLGVSGNSDNLFRNNSGVNYPYSFGTAADITSSSAGGNYYYFFYDIEISPYLSEYNHLYICNGDSVQVGSNIYTIPGTYIDTFTSTNIWGCDSVVYTELELYQTSSLSIASLPDPAEICLGDTILLEASTGFSEYYWIYSNAIIGQNQNILLSPSEDTWYLLKAIDQYGCLVQEDIWVYVDTCFVGLDDPIIYNINIYPNPSFGIFKIDFNNVFDNNLNIKIVNSLGNVVVLENLKAGQRIKEFNLSEFSKGIYFIELQTEIGVYKKKIILK